MKPRSDLFITVIFMIAALLITVTCSKNQSQVSSATETLSSGWKMQPADKLKDVDESSVSINDFNDTNWYEAVVPGTVLGSLASKKVVEDPYFGINMQKIDTSQFKQPWWFRKSFELSAADLKKKISLRFNGINYRADLYVNGKKVADKDTFAGALQDVHLRY